MRAQDDEPVYTQRDDYYIREEAYDNHLDDYYIREEAYDNYSDDYYPDWEDDDEML